MKRRKMSAQEKSAKLYRTTISHIKEQSQRLTNNLQRFSWV